MTLERQEPAFVNHLGAAANYIIPIGDWTSDCQRLLTIVPVAETILAKQDYYNQTQSDAALFAEVSP